MYELQHLLKTYFNVRNSVHNLSCGRQTRARLEDYDQISQVWIQVAYLMLLSMCDIGVQRDYSVPAWPLGFRDTNKSEYSCFCETYGVFVRKHVKNTSDSKHTCNCIAEYVKDWEWDPCYSLESQQSHVIREHASGGLKEMETNYKCQRTSILRIKRFTGFQVEVCVARNLTLLLNQFCGIAWWH